MSDEMDEDLEALLDLEDGRETFAIVSVPGRGVFSTHSSQKWRHAGLDVLGERVLGLVREHASGHDFASGVQWIHVDAYAVVLARAGIPLDLRTRRMGTAQSPVDDGEGGIRFGITHKIRLGVEVRGAVVVPLPSWERAARTAEVIARASGH